MIRHLVTFSVSFALALILGASVPAVPMAVRVVIAVVVGICLTHAAALVALRWRVFRLDRLPDGSAVLIDGERLVKNGLLWIGDRDVTTATVIYPRSRSAHRLPKIVVER